MAAASTIIAAVAAVGAIGGAVAMDQNAKSQRFHQKGVLREQNKKQDALERQLKNKAFNDDAAVRQAMFKKRQQQLSSANSGLSFGSGSLGNTSAPTIGRKRLLGE